MLVNLKIKNVALIDSLDISFDEQLNVISGETGSGKSIMLNAMGFVFGDRLDKTLLREGTDHMRVDAFFDNLGAGICSYIKELTGISIDNDELVITREYFESGKTVCKLNNETVNTSILKKVSGKLIDVHGQHEHQSLMDNEYQLDILDMFSRGEIEPYLDNLNKLIDELNDINKNLNQLGGNVEQKQNLIDLYKYQINEIESANIKDGEYEQVLQEIKEMKAYEKISEKLQESYSSLTDNPYFTPAIDLVNTADKNILSIKEFGDKYEELSTRLSSVSLELTDIAQSIRDILNNCNFDINKLEELDVRADCIKELFRKYGGDYEGLNKYYLDVQDKLYNLINSEARHLELLEKYEKTLNKIHALQDEITAIRKRNAKEFALNIQKEIQLLGMSSAVVQIDIQKREEEYSRKGQDCVEFMFSANVGFTPKPLAKIASGGELSRFMLAYKIVVADLDEINTLIFDEIDTGLSGKMAHVVAQCLAKLSINKQVITISHLPQLAGMADLNFKVEKYSDNSTHTKLNIIDKENLYIEIARLMGLGENVQAINVAQEFKQECDKYKTEIRK